MASFLYDFKGKVGTVRYKPVGAVLAFFFLVRSDGVAAAKPDKIAKCCLGAIVRVYSSE